MFFPRYSRQTILDDGEDEPIVRRTLPRHARQETPGNDEPADTQSDGGEEDFSVDPIKFPREGKGLRHNMLDMEHQRARMVDQLVRSRMTQKRRIF